MKLTRISVLLCWLVLSASSDVLGQEAQPKTENPQSPPAEEGEVFLRDKDQTPAFEKADVRELDKIPVKEVSPGIYQIGTVRLDQKKKAISFPATVNQTRGPAEYLLVTSWGAVHESAFQTKTRPMQIHIAMLLLGVKKQTAAFSKEGEGQAPSINQGAITVPSKEVLEGRRVTVSVSWEADGETHSAPIDRFIQDIEAEGKKPSVELIYNGSAIINNLFAGEIEGSVISLITNRLALMNNTTDGRLTDDVWQVNSETIMARDSDVTIHITLQSE